MPRKPQTAEQIAARVAKAKATKAAKKAAALEQIGATAPKPLKKLRKIRNLTAEQKKAAADRLAAAREARASNAPSQNTTIAEEVRLLPDDNVFSLKNVRLGIKTNKELLVSMRKYKDSKEASERAQYTNIETYVANLESYLRTGCYTDFRYGENGQNRVTYVCRAMAYHSDGRPKRSVGVIYPDIGLYTQEMYDEDHHKAEIKTRPKKKAA